MLNYHQSYKLIRSAESKGLTACVVELCRNHLRRFLDDALTWLWYSMALTEFAQYRQAQKAIRRAISLCPKQKQRIAFAQMGHLFDAKGDLKRAAVWYRRASRADLKDASCHIYLGHAAFRRGLLRQAESHYRTAIKSRKGCIDEAYFNLGGVLLAKRRYKEAVACYQKALKIDPDYTIARKRLKDAKLALRLVAC